MWKWLEISFLEAKNLTPEQLKSVAEVEKDMWAFGIWEYVYCKDCQSIFWKNDIFGNLPEEIRRKSVIFLEEHYLWDSICCKKCKSTNTVFIYGVDRIIEVQKDKYFNSEDSFISLLNSSDWEIVWYCDWYVTDPEKIYNLELEWHYREIGFKAIMDEIKKKIWDISKDRYFTIGWAWTSEEHKSIVNYLRLIQNFTANTPKKYWDTPAFVELETWSVVCAILNLIWFEKLDLPTELVINKSKDYNSNLYFIDEMVNKACLFLSEDVREILSNNKNKLRELMKS